MSPTTWNAHVWERVEGQPDTWHGVCYDVATANAWIDRHEGVFYVNGKAPEPVNRLTTTKTSRIGRMLRKRRARVQRSAEMQALVEQAAERLDINRAEEKREMGL